MNRIDKLWQFGAAAILGGVLVASLGAMLVVVPEHLETAAAGCRSVEKLGEMDKAVIDQIEKMVDLGLKLSTALAALSAALVLGLKKAFRLTPAARICLAASSCCFSVSTYFGFSLKRELAELFVIGCAKLYALDPVQDRLLAHYYFFVGGVSLFAGLVVMEAFAPARKGAEETFDAST
jgi:hypothetical protein